ncbi:FMN-dependent NADH-azoreductase [Sphingomonas sp. So64.6b]|uniref:FMN-dependent NADH-azoreductase n=1 Tax=Sphingomonas sp. So64.6b TaxID=2997354 RepID=UPI001602F100|nr:NAD(P)H-dependent oxidoreductase [Sphingomonas sp. So64.6b]QNA86592.1 FMN-dependent NADH-azoreductase [Sphingomonas sp. So64.6b]
MKLLHIDSSILGDNSVSRILSAGVVQRLVAATPSLEMSRRDLAAEPLTHVDLASLPADTSEAALASTDVLEEFIAADVVVIGAPMYNFTIPSQLKAWLDRILIAGKTFSYGPEGVQGLVTGKRVIVAVSRGNFYGADSPAASFEHLESYLASVFGFIGIVPEFIVAEGVATSPEGRTTAIAAAQGEIAALAA